VEQPIKLLFCFLNYKDIIKLFLKLMACTELTQLIIQTIK